MTNKAEANQVVAADVVVAANVVKEAVDTSETVGAGAADRTNLMGGCFKTARPMSLANKAKANEAAIPFFLTNFPQFLRK